MNAPQKYCFLFVSAPFGGIEVFARNLQAIVAEKYDNVESHWLFIERTPSERFASLPVVSRNWTLKAGMVARSRIHSLERHGARFDAAFFNSIVPLTLLGGFAKRVPVVLSVDTTPHLLQRYERWYQIRSSKPQMFFSASARAKKLKRVYSSAHTILPWSDLVNDSLLHDYQVSEGKLTVVPPGIDVTMWTKSPRSAHEPDPNKSPNILFVGGDFTRKGGDVLLKIAQQEEFRYCDFHIVTPTHLHVQARNIHIHNELHANSERLVAMYSAADVFVFPTRADFAPTNAICEAMSMELPIISTNVGGIDKVVIDGKTGFIIPVDDSAALADRLRVLLFHISASIPETE